MTTTTSAPADARGPVGPDEETVRIERELFERRRRDSRRSGRRRLRRPLLVCLVLVVVVGLGWLVGWSPVLAADKVEVHGVETLNPVLVEQTAAVPIGRPMARIDTGAVRERLSALPAVLSSRVSRQWPGTVRIDVTERRAAAVVPRGASWRALSPDGVLFRRYEKRPEGLPEIRDETGTDRDALQEAARVVGALPGDLLRRVDHVSVASVDEIRLTLRNGRTVVWGDADQSRDKARVLGVLVDRKVSQIDVSVPSRPTTRG